MPKQCMTPSSISDYRNGLNCIGNTFLHTYIKYTLRGPSSLRNKQTLVDNILKIWAERNMDPELELLKFNERIQQYKQVTDEKQNIITKIKQWGNELSQGDYVEVEFSILIGSICDMDGKSFYPSTKVVTRGQIQTPLPNLRVALIDKGVTWTPGTVIPFEYKELRVTNDDQIPQCGYFVDINSGRLRTPYDAELISLVSEINEYMN